MKSALLPACFKAHDIAPAIFPVPIQFPEVVLPSFVEHRFAPGDDRVTTRRLKCKKPADAAGFSIVVFQMVVWLRGQDLNLRPSGYGPKDDELPRQRKRSFRAGDMA